MPPAYTSAAPAPQYHWQDTLDQCGAATTQMVLLDSGEAAFDQADVYRWTALHTADKSFYSGPDGILATLTNYPLVAGRPFELLNHATSDDLSREMAWALHQTGVPLVAFVFGFHWVLVWGVSANQAPTSPNDPALTVEYFFIHDPTKAFTGAATPVTPPPPPPHTAGDPCPSASWDERHISAGSWKTLYMKPIKTDPYKTAGGYLAIGHET